MFSSLVSSLGFPEYILMTVFYRFFSNLELVIKDTEKHFSDLGKKFEGRGGRIILN